MEFHFNVQQVLGHVAVTTKKNGSVAILDGEKIRVGGQILEQVKQVIDSMGHASGKVRIRQKLSALNLFESFSDPYQYPSNLFSSIFAGSKTSFDNHDSWQIAGKRPHNLLQI